MSFIELTNTKNEKMLINLDYVMHFSSSPRKGVIVEFFDGLTFSFYESFDEITCLIRSFGDIAIKRKRSELGNPQASRSPCFRGISLH